MEKYELHYTVIQQLPLRVREILATVDFADFQRISQCLAHLDLTFNDKQTRAKQSDDSRAVNLEKRGAENGNYESKSRDCKSGQGYGRGSTSAKVNSSYIHICPSHSTGRINESNGSFPNMTIPPPSHFPYSGQFDSCGRSNLNL